MGGSYGGYLTMMAVTNYPDMWAAGVPIVPFVNWFTELANEDPQLHEYDISIMGDPVKNKALYEDRSPINFIDRVKAPLLLICRRQRSARSPRRSRAGRRRGQEKWRHRAAQNLRERRPPVLARRKPDRRLPARRRLPEGPGSLTRLRLFDL